MANTRSHHEPELLELQRIPLVQFCHRAIFALIVFVLLYSVVAYGTAQRWVQGPLIAAIILAAIFWAVRLVVAHDAQVVFSPLGAPVILAGAYFLIRYALTRVESVARSPMLLAVAAVLFFFIVLNDIRHRWQITTLVWLVTGLGVLLAAAGLWQVFWSGWGRLGAWSWESVRGRARGTFSRPGDLAVFLQVAFAMAAANFALSRRARAEKVGLAVAGVLLCVGLLLTFSVWHWLGWGAAFVVVALFAARKHTWHFRWVIAGACVLIAVVATVAIGITSQSPSAGKRTVNVRNKFVIPPGSELAPPAESPVVLRQRALWKAALSVGQTNPWIGAGGGMFPWLFPHFRTVQGLVEYCPNQYLAVYAEYGVIGVVLFLWIAIAAGLALVRILQLRDTKYSTFRLSNRYAFVVAGLAITLACGVDAGFDLNLQTGGLLFPLLGIVAAALTCGVHRRVDEYEQPQKSQSGRHVTIRLHGKSRYVVVAGLVGLILLLGLNLGRTYPAELLLQRGQRALNAMEWDEADHLLQSAWRLDSRSYQVAEVLGDLHAGRATWNLRGREASSLKALEWYNRALTLNQYAYDVRVKIGRLNDALGNKPAEAVAAYRQALSADGRNASYHVLFGQYYLRRGDAAEAQHQFGLARELGAIETLPADETVVH